MQRGLPLLLGFFVHRVCLWGEHRRRPDVPVGDTLPRTTEQRDDDFNKAVYPFCAALAYGTGAIVWIKYDLGPVLSLGIGTALTVAVILAISIGRWILHATRDVVAAKVACPHCKGTGQIPGWLWGTNDCSECRGTGAIASWRAKD